jgi:hypothetical protein
VIYVIPAHSLNLLILDCMVIIVDLRISEPFNFAPVKPIFYPEKLRTVFCEECSQKIWSVVVKEKFLIFLKGNGQNERFKSVLMARRKFFRAY